FIRCKELDKEESYFESVLLEGGNISFDAYMDSYKKNYEDLRLSIERRMYSDDLVICLDEFTNKGSLLAVEKKIAKALEDFMKKSNRISFGPEPVFAFFWRFENHMQILRTIFVGKLNMLSNEEIRKHALTI
ncbi:MAG: V-type ATPase subunit, partial [Bacteroidales bacterium]|nr:V-type ATPase subunit [Bacteroidales bacterium]